MNSGPFNSKAQAALPPPWHTLLKGAGSRRRAGTNLPVNQGILTFYKQGNRDPASLRDLPGVAQPMTGRARLRNHSPDDMSVIVSLGCLSGGRGSTFHTPCPTLVLRVRSVIGASCIHLVLVPAAAVCRVRSDGTSLRCGSQLMGQWQPQDQTP